MIHTAVLCDFKVIFFLNRGLAHDEDVFVFGNTFSIPSHDEAIIHFKVPPLFGTMLKQMLTKAMTFYKGNEVRSKRIETFLQ